MFSSDTTRDLNPTSQATGSPGEKPRGKREKITTTSPIIRNDSNQMPTVSSPRNKKPIFKEKPVPRITVQEGASLILRCRVEEPLFTAVWNKDFEPIVMWQNNIEDPKLDERFSFIGDLQRADYAIELRHAQLNDSGRYVCQVTPQSTDNIEGFHVETSITVIKAPPTTTSAPSTKTAHVIMPAPRPSAFANQKVSTTPLMPPRALPDAIIGPSWTKLPGGYGAIDRARLIPDGSADSSHNHAKIATPSFPYILAALVGLLFIFDIYLVCKAVGICRRRRSQRRRKNISPSFCPS